MTFESTGSVPPTDESTGSVPPTNLPPLEIALNMPHPDSLRLIAVASPEIIRATIKSLHKLGYADLNDWSKLLPTACPGQMMAILTKRVVS